MQLQLGALWKPVVAACELAMVGVLGRGNAGTRWMLVPVIVLPGSATAVASLCVPESVATAWSWAVLPLQLACLVQPVAPDVPLPEARSVQLSYTPGFGEAVAELAQRYPAALARALSGAVLLSHGTLQLPAHAACCAPLSIAAVHADTAHACAASRAPATEVARVVGQHCECTPVMPGSVLHQVTCTAPILARAPYRVHTHWLYKAASPETWQRVLESSAAGSLSSTLFPVCQALHAWSQLRADAAARQAHAVNFSLITGRVGSGKTFACQALVRAAESLGWKARHVQAHELKRAYFEDTVQALRHALPSSTSGTGLPSLVCLDDVDALLPAGSLSDELPTAADPASFLSARRVAEACALTMRLCSYSVFIVGTCSAAVSGVATASWACAAEVALDWRAMPALAHRAMCQQVIHATLPGHYTRMQAHVESWCDRFACGWSPALVRVVLRDACMSLWDAHRESCDVSWPSLRAELDRARAAQLEAARGAQATQLAGIGAVCPPQPVPLRQVAWAAQQLAALRAAVITPLLAATAVGAGGAAARYAPAGVLLHGPAGTGKSTIAHAVANALAQHSGVTAWVVQCGELVSKAMGGTEHAIAGVFALARAHSPCLLVLDNLSSIAPPRAALAGTHRAAMLDRTLSTLLTQLDGAANKGASSASSGAPAVLVLGIAREPGDVDGALTRAGRLEERISMGVLDERAASPAMQLLTEGVSIAGQAGKLGRGEQAALAKQWATSWIGQPISALAGAVHSLGWQAARQAMAEQAEHAAIASQGVPLELAAAALTHRPLLGTPFSPAT